MQTANLHIALRQIVNQRVIKLRRVRTIIRICCRALKIHQIHTLFNNIAKCLPLTLRDYYRCHKNLLLTAADTHNANTHNAILRKPQKKFKVVNFHGMLATQHHTHNIS